MKVKLLIIILLCTYFTTVFSFNKCETDTNFLKITVKEYVGDTMIFDIENISADTLFFSIYRQEMSEDSIIMTNNYDIFYGAISSVVIRILPESKIEFKERIDEIVIYMYNDSIYNDNPIKGVDTKIAGKYRLLVKVKKRINDNITDRFYSNWVYRR